MKLFEHEQRSLATREIDPEQVCNDRDQSGPLDISQSCLDTSCDGISLPAASLTDATSRS